MKPSIRQLLWQLLILVVAVLMSSVSAHAVDTTPPNLTITSPTNGGTYTNDQEITIAATASDYGSGIDRVQLKIDGQDMGSINYPGPYECPWPLSDAFIGQHSIAVIAYDNAGNSTTRSISVNVVLPDTSPPTLTIISPTNGSTHTQAETITISADASDASGINRVELFIDGVPLGPDYVAPYTCPWDLADASVGDHTIQLVAYDNAGNYTTRSVTIHVVEATGTEKPEGFHDGIDGFTTWGWAYDPDSPSESVLIHLYMDGPALSGVLFASLRTDVYRPDVNKAKDITGDHGFSYTIPDDIVDTLPAGEHEIYAYAIDYEGVQGNNVLLRRSPHSFQIVSGDITPPTVSITSPADGTTLYHTETVKIIVVADDASGIDKVELYIDNDYIGKDMSEPYECEWKLGDWSLGSHSVKVIAFDNAGNTASDEVIVTIVETTGTEKPVGFHDGIDGFTTWGWAYDPDTPSESVLIHLYMDGPAGSGVLFAAPRADVYRPDVNKAKDITGDHGFRYTIPDDILDTLSYGEHEIYAYAIDYEGVQGNNVLLNRSPHSFEKEYDHIYPTLTVITPHDNQTLCNSQIVPIIAEATDNIGIERVELKLDYELRDTDYDAPYEFELDLSDVSTGHHDIYVTAYDYQGNFATVHLRVDVVEDDGSRDCEIPTCTITEPQDGATVNPWDNITCKVEATDNVGVDYVQLWYIGDLFSIERYDFEPPWEFELDWLPDVPEMEHDNEVFFFVTAYDATGNWARDDLTLYLNEEPDTEGPIVTITSPPNNGTYFDSDNLMIAASVTDRSAIDRVQLFIDGVDRGSIYEEPYQCPVSLVGFAPGYHTFEVKAYDILGNVGSAMIWTWVAISNGDVTRPDLTITSPDDGSTYDQTDEMLVAADATDASDIMRVDMHIDGIYMGHDRERPFECPWPLSSDAAGSHTLTLTAYDYAANHRSRSITYNVNDGSPPSVAITSPDDGAVFWTGETPTIRAEVTDPSGIQKVALYFDDDFVEDDRESPYEFPYPMADVAPGDHTIRVIAYDNLGNNASDEINIEVRDVEYPWVEITEPDDGAVVSTSTYVVASADAFGGVTKVEFKVDGQLKATDASEPFRWLWPVENYSEGQHTISAIAYNQLGNTDSDAITVTVGESSPYETEDNLFSALIPYAEIIPNADVQIQELPDPVAIHTPQLWGEWMLVVRIDPALIKDMPATASSPFWWKYYRSFWDDNGVHLKDKLGTSSTDDCVYDGIDQSVWVATPSGQTYCGHDVSFYNATFYDTRIMDQYADLMGNQYRGWIHHVRKRFNEDWIPGWSYLGPTYYTSTEWVTGNFGIELGNKIEWIDNGYGLCYNPGYWESVMWGETHPDGWGVVPTAPDPVGGGLGWQFVFVLPEGETVEIGPPPQFECESFTPTITGPFPPTGLVEARDQAAFDKLDNLITLMKESRLAMGGSVDVNPELEGKKAYIDPFGEVFPFMSDDQLALMAEQDGESIVLTSGSLDSWDRAVEKARTLALEKDVPVIMHYMPQSIKYWDADGNPVTIDSLQSLIKHLDAAEVPITLFGHSWSGHVVGNALMGLDPKYKDNIVAYYPVNPAHGLFGTANADWQNFLSSTNIEVYIQAGEFDAVSQLGLGVGILKDSPFWEYNTEVNGSLGVYWLIQNKDNIHQNVVYGGHHGWWDMMNHGMGANISLPPAQKLADPGDEAAIPNDFFLAHNYPNPFNPSTTIEFGLPKNAHVRLDVFNILGQKVVTLLDEQKTAGYHVVKWDGQNESGQSVSTSIYLYRITAGDFVESKKMVLLK